MKTYFENRLVYFYKRDSGQILIDVGLNCSLDLRLVVSDYMKFYYRGSRTINIRELNKFFKRSWKWANINY